MRSCSIVDHFIDVCSDTDDPSKNIRLIIIDQVNNTNSYKKKDFGIQGLSPYIKDLIGHMIGIENVVQNALNNDRTYDD